MNTLCLTAEQAKARTSTVPPHEILEISHKCLRNINCKIEEAADNGYRYIIYNIYHELSEKIIVLESSKTYFQANMDMALNKVRDYLETLDYKVNAYCCEDEILYRISWEEE